jgi:large subunit ribosomal protein L9
VQVILLTDVEKVGLRGEVVDVARGYARNFLVPRKLAEPATPARVAELEKRAAQRAHQEASSFEQARELATQLEQVELRFDAKAGPTGSLFGSVTATDLADEIWRVARIRVDRRKIALDDPIKRIGRYMVPIEVFTDVSVEVKTLVVPEGGDLPPEEELPTVPVAEANIDPAAAAAAEAQAAAEQSEEPVITDVVDEVDATEVDVVEPADVDAGEPADESGQVPEDAFDRASDDALSSGDERL